MKIFTLLEPGSSVPPGDLAAVVVDVLRATTTICAFLEGGGLEVVASLSLKGARRVKASRGEGWVLAGERGCLKPRGFDLDNSPRAALEAARAGARGMAISTTNGTRAVLRAVRRSREVLLGCMRNAPSCAALLAQMGKEVVFHCAGRDGRVGLDDAAVVGAILAEMEGLGARLELDDPSRMCLALWRHLGEDPKRALLEAEHARRLLELGLEGDLEFCAALGASRVVPRVRGAEGSLAFICP